MEISIVIKMQQVNFETSMKNIPLGGKKEYVMQLTKSVRKVVYHGIDKACYTVCNVLIAKLRSSTSR